MKFEDELVGEEVGNDNTVEVGDSSTAGGVGDLRTVGDKTGAQMDSEKAAKMDPMLVNLTQIKGGDCDGVSDGAILEALVG